MANDNTLFPFQPDAALSRRSLLGAGSAAAAAWALAPASALAQAKWPAKPVTLVVPFLAGGGTDVCAPHVGAASSSTGTQLVIDNRGGAGGTLGAGIAAKRSRDGYTLFMGAVHHAIAPQHVHPTGTHDIRKTSSLALGQRARCWWWIQTYRRLQGVSGAGQSQPRKMNYGSAGGGTSHHLAGELFKRQTGTFITHIPYRGAGPALQDLMAAVWT